MKGLLIISLLLLSINYSHAQFQGEQRLQLGSEYGSGTNLFGFGLVGELFLIDRLSVAPSFMILLPETGKASSLSVDTRYYVNEGTLQFYGLLGFNYFRRRLEFAPEDENLIQRPGLNIGGGFNYRLSEEFSLDTQIKFQPQNNNNFVIGIGVNYHIN